MAACDLRLTTPHFGRGPKRGKTLLARAMTFVSFERLQALGVGKAGAAFFLAAAFAAGALFALVFFALAAALTALRASLAFFLACLNALRACFRLALAARTALRVDSTCCSASAAWAVRSLLSAAGIETCLSSIVFIVVDSYASRLAHTPLVPAWDHAMVVIKS